MHTWNEFVIVESEGFVKSFVVESPSKLTFTVRIDNEYLI